MFIGHFAVGFAAKSAARRTSLGWLLLGALFLDLLWPVFLSLGWERVQIDPGNTAVSPLAFEWYPWSHSLIMTVIWATFLTTAVLTITRDMAAGIVVFGAVQSHWVLDWLAHGPDMPIWPAGPFAGLGLWTSVPGTIVVEGTLFALGVWLYATSTRARDRAGRWVWWGFIVLLLALYAGNFLSPPPPSVKAIAWAGLATWIFPVLGWWIDRHREAIG